MIGYHGIDGIDNIWYYGVIDRICSTFAGWNILLVQVYVWEIWNLGHQECKPRTDFDCKTSTTKIKFFWYTNKNIWQSQEVQQAMNITMATVKWYTAMAAAATAAVDLATSSASSNSAIIQCREWWQHYSCGLMIESTTDWQHPCAVATMLVTQWKADSNNDHYSEQVIRRKNSKLAAGKECKKQSTSNYGNSKRQ